MNLDIIKNIPEKTTIIYCLILQHFNTSILPILYYK